MTNDASRPPLPVLVRLPVLFASLFPAAERRVGLFVENVEEVIAPLEARWPGMRDRLCDTTPAIRRHINGFVAGHRARLETPFPPGAAVYVLRAVSGAGAAKAAARRCASPNVNAPTRLTRRSDCC